MASRNSSKATSSQVKRGATTLYDKMTDIDTPSNIYWFDEVESTMVKARELIDDNKDRDSFAVVAGHQSVGRGTRGRTWVSGSGNLFLTVVLRLSSIPAPLTLIPLRIGTLIIPSIQSRVTSGSQVFLKWPNDVLIDEKKVCGVLIEIEGDFMLVGIGCNVMTAPDVQSTGEDNGRPSTCLANHMQYCGDSENKDTCPSNVPLDEIHKEIAAEIYGALSSYTKQSSDPATQVITDFEKYMNFNPQKLRSAHTAGDEVTPVRINTDGTLQVYMEQENREMALVADYLW
mmetsp:Transcript_18185/g.17522  ORF Transcript_18185/g.17522 Transcript_18185/m.17522 type:complete len:287 (+) Transcript_18185:316-1176(+)